MNNVNSISKLAGASLKKLRNEAGFTAFQFAKMTGIKSEQQLYRYERGVNKIGIDELVAALKILSIDIGEFFEKLDKDDVVTEEQVDIDKDRYYIESQAVAGSFASSLLRNNNTK